MKRDYEIILNEDGKEKCIYMTIKRKHKTIFQCLTCFINKLMQFIYEFFSKIIFFLYMISLLFGMLQVNEPLSLFAGVLALNLTISLKLFKNYPFVGYEINLIAILMSVIIFFILSFCAPFITLDNKLKFLRLQNLGNTLGYIGLFISMFDSSFNSKKMLRAQSEK